MTIPANLRVPFVAVEIDNSRAVQGPAELPYRALLIGQKLASGSATGNSLHRVTSAEQVAQLAGRGSQLHRQARAFFTANRSTETWIGVLEDAGAGVAAEGEIAITGPATAAGALNLYIGGVLVQLAVASGDSANSVATALAAAINANGDLPVTAVAATGTVTVTARNKGTVGNGLDLRLNLQDGERLPLGIGATITPMAAGATDPVLTSLLAALGDTWFQVIAHPYADATSLSAIETELADRFGPMRMIDGVAITCAAGSHGTLAALGGGRNSPHSVILSQPGQNPVTPPDEFAAAVAGVVAFYAPADPARPFQTLTIPGVRAPAEPDRFTLEERNLLLYDGIATTRVDAAGQVQVERLITTYQTSQSGAVDTSYLDLTTLLTIMYLRFTFRNVILLRYPRHKLANDGTRFASGQPVITPKLAKAEAVLWFRQMEQLGLVEGFEQFKRDVSVVRSSTDPNRLEFLLPPDLINQFIVGAVALQFRL